MAQPDAVFLKSYRWFRESVDQALSSVPAVQRPPMEQLIWQLLGVASFNTPLPANPDLHDFTDTGAAADSLAVAAQVVGESLVALESVKQAVDGLQGGNPAAALATVERVIQQVETLQQPAGGRYPSAFSLAKILLSLSEDAQTVNAPSGKQAEKLARLLGATSDDDVSKTQTALGLLTLLTGCMLDRSFKHPSTQPAAAWVQQALPPLVPDVSLPLQAPGLPPGVGVDLHFNTGAPTGVQAALKLGLNTTRPLNGTTVTTGLQASSGVNVFLPVAPSGQVQVSGDFELLLSLARLKTAGTLVIGPFHGISLRIGELGVALALRNGAPSLVFLARQGKATLQPDNAFLKLLLGNSITVDFAIEAQADQFGHLRLKNGTGLHASLPVPTLPTGPFKLQLINFEIEPVNGSFLHLRLELSASFGVDLGPFQASVDRLGVQVDLDLNRPNPLAIDFKPPNGIGLSLDAGVVKGGGYLFVNAGEYAGVLELKLMAIDVKAIAILNTQSDVGYSLLLLIYGQFPPIQLSFGFTLTGIGGLIGVQHTTSVTALSQGLSNGSLDAILFPANPVGDAPKIINTLRTLFPVKSGGFVIGPMLELGWGTPSLVTVRLGLLIEAGQFAFLGQAIVQLPPLVEASLALLHLEVDIVGSVVFDPLRIAFDARLRNSRVAFLSLTGQFAFRAQFGDHPTFLISAGGFHPRFKEVPADIPAPFERVGTSFDIGIIGISFKGYFAITSATVQAGSELRLWADLGVADIEGGWGFDAICYLEPKFYFEVDLRAYVAVHVFGLDFAAIRIEGLLAGPGRWRIAGRGTVELPLVPDVHIHIDESWGTDRTTPAVTIRLADKLAEEINRLANWSAQLPRGGEGTITLADIQGVTDLLAHPLGSLSFQQKLIPLELRLNKVGGSKIDGANEYFGPALQLSQAETPPVSQPLSTQKDFFAAAQFLDMSQDDRLGKPSFEALPAGYVLQDDAFELGEMVPQTLSYEEADLGADEPVPRVLRHLSLSLFHDKAHGPLMQFGAAGRSALRDKAWLQPVQMVPIKVNPVPMAVASKDTLAPTLGGESHDSYWQADQARALAQTLSPRPLQVAELAELA